MKFVKSVLVALSVFGVQAAMASGEMPDEPNTPVVSPTYPDDGSGNPGPDGGPYAPGGNGGIDDPSYGGTGGGSSNPDDTGDGSGDIDNPSYGGI